ncbi:serine/arginine-rich SC35-like splicing factor SCL30A isoform X1 [Impatiens glandulifera]|uniref:serine/arginine-rich SC35-like splicing factor SCL30A isoform X1 n=1 Tax=Impatiens glandulifera TaxID=253017 RepID=UPI001FB17EF3|nr:serine/arginine-rich SC35-like splicing factor SCL30A isoform X1 [Impatiens glandulifera]
MRGRSYSPSPPRGSPPRGYGRRGRSPSPRGPSPRGRDSDLPTSLLVRNLRHDCRQEDLRRPFGQFGPLKDIYLPRNYYSGEARGFGFVQFVDPFDAAEAKSYMDGQTLLGRQLTVLFAEENRKKPGEMRHRERGSRGRGNDRRRSPPRRYSRSPPRRYSRSPPRRYSRSPPRRYSRSPPPPSRNNNRSRSRSADYYSPSPRRSGSPQERRYNKEERSISRSPILPQKNGDTDSRSPIPPQKNGGTRSRSRSRSPYISRSRSRSASPVNNHHGSPARPRSLSPNPEE